MESNIFRAYDIRGIYPDEINESGALKLGKAIAKYLDVKNIIVGYDARASTPVLVKNLIEGILSQGIKVSLIGQCTTPLFYFAVNNSENSGGIMVTASHNPPQYNGFKIVRSGGIPVSLNSGLANIRELSETEIKDVDTIGQVDKLNFTDKYIDKIVKLSGAGKINKDLKIIIDASNGMAPVVLEPLAQKLNLNFERLYFDIDGSFPNHAPDTSKETNLTDLKKRVLDSGADVGFAFDGDGDRVAMIDEKGQRVGADFIMGLIYKHIFPNQKFVYDLRFSKSIRELLSKNGVRSKPGHTFVKQIMRETDAVFGGELSGHFMYKDLNYAESAALTMLLVLKILSENKKTISELVAPFAKYVYSGEINIEISDENPKADIIKRLKEKYKDGKIDGLDGLTVEYPDWWFNIRLSNTEPLLRLVIEADTKELMESKKEELVNLIKYSV